MTSEGARFTATKGSSLMRSSLPTSRPSISSRTGASRPMPRQNFLSRNISRVRLSARAIWSQIDDAYGQKFLDINVEHKVPFSLKDAEPYNVDDKSVRFVFKHGEVFTVPLPGLFNLKNVLAAITLGAAMGIPLKVMQKSARASRTNRGPSRARHYGPAVCGRCRLRTHTRLAQSAVRNLQKHIALSRS
jgi:hypothetical protein